jgi:hypothetical protein
MQVPELHGDVSAGANIGSLLNAFYFTSAPGGGKRGIVLARCAQDSSAVTAK